MPVTHDPHLPDPAWPTDKAAEGELEVVRQFLNTVNLESGADRLRDPEATSAWLTELTDPLTSATATEHRRLVRFREATRELISFESRASREQWAAAASKARYLIDSDVLDYRPTNHGIDGLIAGYAKTVMTARADGTWSRLRTCANDDCRWVFYDRSKSRTGSWCSMDVCGSRAKMRAYRERAGR